MQNNINFYDTSTTVLNEVEPGISSLSTGKITADTEPQTHADNPNIMVDQTKQPYNYENFHLDPQDFQNFLLINPPLTEYSNYYYMNAYNNNSGNNNNGSNNNSHSHSHNNHSFHNTSEIQAQAQAQAPAQANPASVADGSLPSEFNESLLDNLDPSGVASTFDAQSSSTQFPQQSQLQRGQPNSFTSLQSAAIPTPQLTHNNSNTNGHSHPSLNFNGLSSSFQPFPKRRLSISNGQIGQISMMVHQKDLENLENNNLNNGPQFRTANNNFDDDVDNENEIEVDDDEDDSNAPIEVDKNGVPCRQLIYNNQVIFNPDGPIPGTASWKRQKILERNRIAASKCRQKKKNLQKKLQQDVEELSRKNSRLESMLSHIKTRLTIYSEKSGVSVDEILGINTSNGNGSLNKPTDDASSLVKSEPNDYIPIDKKANNRSSKNSKSSKDNAQFDDDVELERKLCEWMSGAGM